MFSAETYRARRAELCRRIGEGLILIPGNFESPSNYPNNAYPFRQDSTFLYLFGLNLPSLAGTVDAATGQVQLFGDDATIDDIIWTGPLPAMAELAARVGVERCLPFASLSDTVREALAAGRTVHFLPPYRGETKMMLAGLLGIPIAELHARKSLDLLFAIAEMREVKSDEELAELERAFEIGYSMHTTAMQMCRPGILEREIRGAIDGRARSLGEGVSFPSIVTQHGETLHCHDCGDPLESGRLLLCDAGGETTMNYISDHTRTYPVNGRFTDRQRDIYNIVLRAHDQIVPYMREGAMYADINRRALTLLAEGLREAGLLKVAADEAVAAGAMYMFMPHGLSHGIGLDVHDCEAFGERSFDFSPMRERAEASATCIYRAAWRLRSGTVLSDEPGIYFIPALIDKSRAEGLYKGIVDYDRLDAYRDFGGIRIEDDIIVTPQGGRIIGGGRHIPVTIDEVEAFMAAGR